MALDDRYVNKFVPLDSTAIYPKPSHALLYITFHWWKWNALKLYVCLVHIIPSSLMLMLHKHQPTSPNDTIHFISHVTFGSSIANVLALHGCPCPSAPSHCPSFSCGALLQSLRLDLYTCNRSIDAKSGLDLLHLVWWLHVMSHAISSFITCVSNTTYPSHFHLHGSSCSY
jgi:hypothetical protein